MVDQMILAQHLAMLELARPWSFRARLDADGLAALIYYLRESSRGATRFGTAGRPRMRPAAHQAARKGRPRVAADAGEGLPPPQTRAQRGAQPPLGYGPMPALSNHRL